MQESHISSRIKQIIDYKKMSIRAFEIQIGCSNGVIARAIANNTDIQSKWVTKIIELNEDINPTWLLIGKGDMLYAPNRPNPNGDSYDTANDSNKAGSDNSDDIPINKKVLEDIIIEYQTIMRDMRHEIQMLRKKINSLEQKNN